MATAKITATLFIFITLAACSTNEATKSNVELAKQEIGRTEKEFEKMAAEKGIAEAFWFFADSSAVIKRGNDSLVMGKAAIRHFYDRPYFKTASVTWSPDFISASGSADMGYTYGKYTWQAKDTAGNVSESKGVFHTVWKKQADGTWRYVWD